MTSYYLASTGSDGNTGTSEAAPWATIARLNDALAAQQIVGGDFVLFRRGDTFYGQPAQEGWHPYPNANPVTFGAYGAGAKPRISCYKIAAVGGWTNVGGNVWRINLAAGAAGHTGATMLGATEVGHLRVDGTVYGAKKDSSAALAQPWDFYSGDYARTDVSEFLHVYHVGNPSTGRTVEIAVNADVFHLARDHWTIRDLDICGADAGVVASAYWSPSNIQILNCDIHDLGGSYTWGDYVYTVPTRAGNGIQAWIGCEDWLIEGNRIWHCYDVAVTYQGSPGVQVPTNQGYRRLHARRNIIFNNSQSFELGGSEVAGDGVGFVDCSFTDNFCFGAGNGWGWQYRPDPAGRGCHLLFYRYALPTDLVCERNVFFGATTNHIFALDGIPVGVTVRNNHVYLEPGTLIQDSLIPAGKRPETIEEAAAYVAATGHEQGTTWFTDRTAAETYLADLAWSGRVIATTGGVRVIPGPSVEWPEPG
ncbi:hypothetical protein I4I73_21380 [Pseudonocardia sp. KRD-184]|uniref:Right handed beta helix domain-containing protein n=1 Tax=Pseudonocardia oceani TaxID=2792013 RepID=A0ABS6ULA1_9PSEU|nr:hypothetical protein [Pseudonocardia oceani]MBW0090503.1 hypothetical protein [Pseudonocardia oceani]MBW0098544.1 hypothetical protein [Pseudonocardia oceani]MBW0124384.1 hypothetical protein [Pseudonocardia oceani]MBW0131154.1 hypothetical protein [Pseudonocardia oceani]MBW0132584.1 hypothetical protein [Pseudonocardia oceani]